MLVDQVGAEYWQLSWDCAELVLTDFSQLKHCHDSGWVANSHRLGPHVHCLAQGREYETQGHFPVLMGLQESGALLVRPDGHILAVAHAFSEDALQCMQNALQSYMHPSFAPSITTTSPH